MRKKIGLLMGGITLLALSSCDPCYELGDKICECKEESAEARRQCKENLHKARAYKFFDFVKDPQVCRQVFDQCSCSDLLNEKDQKCGFYLNYVE